MATQKNRHRFASKRLGYCMLVPALALIGLTQIYPFLYGVLMSVTDYNLLRPKNTSFIGLGNFVELFTSDKHFMRRYGLPLLTPSASLYSAILLGC